MSSIDSEDIASAIRNIPHDKICHQSKTFRHKTHDDVVRVGILSNFLWTWFLTLIDL
jgi:hypothetical protein